MGQKRRYKSLECFAYVVKPVEYLGEEVRVKHFIAVVASRREMYVMVDEDGDGAAQDVFGLGKFTSWR